MLVCLLDKPQAEKRPAVFNLPALIIAIVGALLQIGGISWDITSHGLGAPETFFTAPHQF